MVRSLDDLIAQAEEMGLRVEEHPLRTHNALLLPGGVIVLNTRRTDVTRRYALAHECGHWHHGHDWRAQHDRKRDEREADSYASRLLISIDDYAHAEALAGGHVGAMAQILEVPPLIVEAYRRTLVRV